MSNTYGSRTVVVGLWKDSELFSFRLVFQIMYVFG